MGGLIEFDGHDLKKKDVRHTQQSSKLENRDVFENKIGIRFINNINNNVMIFIGRNPGPRYLVARREKQNTPGTSFQNILE